VARANAALKDAEAAEKMAVAAAAAAKTPGGAELEAERGLLQQQLENIKPESLDVKLLNKDCSMGICLNPGETLKKRLEEISGGDATDAALKEQNKKVLHTRATALGTKFSSSIRVFENCFCWHGLRLH
jgi:hypothetical protein